LHSPIEVSPCQRCRWGDDDFSAPHSRRRLGLCEATSLCVSPVCVTTRNSNVTIYIGTAC